VKRPIPFLVLIAGLLLGGGAITLSVTTSSAESASLAADPDFAEMRNIQGQIVRIPRDQIVELVPQSPMVLAQQVLAQSARPELPFKAYAAMLRADSAPGSGNPVPTSTPTVTPTATVTPSVTPTPSSTPTPTGTATNSPTTSPSPGTATPTATVVPSSTPTPSPSPTATSVSTPTPTGTATNTATATQSPSPTFTATATATATNTSTNTPVSTPTNTPSPTPTQTQPACERTGARSLPANFGPFPALGGPTFVSGTISIYNPCQGDSITIVVTLSSPTKINEIFVDWGYSGRYQAGGCLPATLSGCGTSSVPVGSGPAMGTVTSGTWSFTFPAVTDPVTGGYLYPMSTSLWVKNEAEPNPASGNYWVFNFGNWILDVPPGP